MRVAILRCQNLPSFVTWDIPNVEELFSDDQLLIDAFRQRGIEAVSVVWSDPDVDWSGFDLALIRSTWDYIDDHEHFLAALSAIEASGCRLFNPLAAVRWNSNKRYLLDLERWGVPTVPTYEASNTARNGWLDVIARGNWPGAVLKPMIGAGGADVRLVQPSEIADTLDRLAMEQPQRKFLVQPLVEPVINEGEWSFIYLGGELSHILLKKPAAGDYRAHGIYGGTVESASAHPRDILQAQAMHARLPFDLLYARLDLVRIDGRLSIMELELIEPLLYFHLAPNTVGKLVDATLAVAAVKP